MNEDASAGHRRPDAIDRSAGLLPGMDTFALRAVRPVFVEGAERCRSAVLDPAHDLGLSPALRAAIGRRVSLGSDRPALRRGYPEPADPSLAALADGGEPADARLRAIARHADLIAADPGRATAADLDRLLEAGLTVPQIVALSELIAFVCFEIRVASGLALLEETP